MKRTHGPLPSRDALVLVGLLFATLSFAQIAAPEGHAIGRISVNGDLIVMELEPGALGKANLFDLEGRTLRFLREASGYRIENTALQWDSDFGPQRTDPNLVLHNFTFPFSGKNWSSFLIGPTGTLSFVSPENSSEANYRDRNHGVSIGRFDALAEAAGKLINTVPAISVFLKPRMKGSYYAKELNDRAVVTWDLTEPYANIQDFTWYKTINRFQAVLHRDGSIDLSYQQLAAKDAIVGVYPILNDKEKELRTIAVDPHPSLPENLDVRRLSLRTLDGVLMRVTLETRGSIKREGDRGLDGIAYRVFFNPHNSHSGSIESSESSVTWTARGVVRDWTGGGDRPRYITSGQGVSHKVETSGNTITFEGVLPPALIGAGLVDVALETETERRPGETVKLLSPHSVHLSGIRSPEIHLSSITRKDGPFPLAYESFHYLGLPNDRDLSCTVIKALGDRFDFLAYYSDFRIDNQEAGTPSDGPKGGNVTGTGENQHDLEAYCTQGRFQWEYVQPVYVGANQMQEHPPDDAPLGGDHDITFYLHQLGERSPDGKLLPYNYAMSQLGHEMGHRWAAFVSAKVNGETVSLGPVHWAQGLEAVVPFPYQRPSEASAMGGGVWQDNFDGTFTQLDDDYYVPATGYSYLDLYLMGLISPAEVPDFFLLKNLVPVGKDANGHRIFRAERMKVTIQDVIAVEGPRLPDVDHSQRKFNTGIVLMVEPGHNPSPELLQRANDIGKRWIDYWQTTTGHRASMTVSPR
jgi:hypothetical protein